MTNQLKNLTAMIVDDEAPMRQHLKLQLQKIWPELLIIAEANNGIHALEQAEKNSPDIIFLDIRMPGKNGIEAATQLTQNAQVIFVTAYDEYAIQAFEKGAVDYLLKPIDIERLSLSCERLKQKFKNKENVFLEQSKQTNSTQANQIKELLTQLVEQQTQQQNSNKEYLHWIQASVGASLRLINTKDILFFKSDEKYTIVKTIDTEYLIRKTLKELEDELNPKEFWRIHRSALVRASAISEVSRDFRGRQIIGLKGSSEKLEVSRNHAHLFQQM